MPSRQQNGSNAPDIWLIILYLVLAFGISGIALMILTRGLAYWWYSLGYSAGTMAWIAKLIYDRKGFGRLTLSRLTLRLIGAGVILFLVAHLVSWWFAIGSTTDLSQQLPKVLSDILFILIVAITYYVTDRPALTSSR